MNPNFDYEHPVVSAGAWRSARVALLVREKELTRLRDEVAAARRALPWVRIDKTYRFDGEYGPCTLADLFGGRTQLVVWHYMFPPEWGNGCRICAFWADAYNAAQSHLHARDVSLVVVSRAPIDRLLAFRARMGWTLPWVSAHGTEFSRDFEVYFDAADVAAGEVEYNYGPRRVPATDLPGLSVFLARDDGAIFHTYSAYARGLDALNPAYQHLDLVPKGRDEAAFPHPMAWVRHHDDYGA
jgi:predicted dithiol-disulfide oxidoreductase (DUF899 family)